jgi:hypothetical protein
VRALLFVAALGAAATATAQHGDAGLDLAIAAVHEAGLRAHEDEVVALYAVVLERSRGNVRVQMPRAFAGRTARPWVLGLRRDGREPQGWPRGVSWPRFRSRWLAILDAADRAVAGELGHTCAVTPEFWGGPGIDDERARALDLVEVPCGPNVRNRFYISRGSFDRAVAEANANPADPE